MFDQIEVDTQTQQPNKFVFGSPEELRKNMYSGDRQHDLELANAVLAGQVEIRSGESQEEGQSTETVESQVPESVNSEEITDPGVGVVPPPVIDDEVDRQRRYNEFVEQQAKEERERYLANLREREEELKKEKAAREELEKKLRQLQEIKEQRPVNVGGTQEEIDEEEEYISGYAKKTRELVDELRGTVGSDNPVIRELVEKVSKFESEIKETKEREARITAEKQKKEAEDKFWENIRKFQKTAPEFNTDRDILDIKRDYERFQKDIIAVSQARNMKEFVAAIEDYYAGGKTKELAVQRGIKEVPEYKTFNELVDLIDFKNGVQLNSITGEEAPILDDQGNQVRYRSLDEAYKVKNFEKAVEQARKQSYKDVAKKLTQFSSAPVTLSDEQTEKFGIGLTVDQEREILNMDPMIWSRDPEKRKLVEMVYAKRGLEPPRYRGR